MNDDNPTPDPAPEGDSGRYAVYDEDLTQYVGSVHPSKAKANAAVKELGKARRHEGHKLTVKQV